MREDYNKTDQKRIEQHYAQMRLTVQPKDASEHGHGCVCKACYGEWAWTTGFETMNPEGRRRMKRRDQKLGLKPKEGK